MHRDDPVRTASPPAAEELTRRLGQVMHGFPFDAALDAAANLVVNGLRQQCTSRAEAERRFDELAARAKAILMDCYDGRGRKKGIFPYAQVIGVPRLG